MILTFGYDPGVGRQDHWLSLFIYRGYSSCQLPHYHLPRFSNTLGYWNWVIWGLCVNILSVKYEKNWEKWFTREEFTAKI